MLKEDIEYLNEEKQSLSKQYKQLEEEIITYQDRLNKYTQTPNPNEYHALQELHEDLSQKLITFKTLYQDYKPMEEIIL